jgi:hypothetical protein
MNLPKKDIDRLNLEWECEQENERIEKRIRIGCMGVCLLITIIMIIGVCR